MAKRTRIPYPLNVAQIAVRDGISADEAWRTFKAIRLNVSRDVFDTLYGEAARAKDNVRTSMNLPLDQIPGAETITPWSTRKVSGYGQRVQVIQQGPDGEIFSSPYLLRTSQLVTPQEAIDAATASYGNNADKYQTKVLGAYYTGTFQMTPGG